MKIIVCVALLVACAYAQNQAAPAAQPAAAAAPAPARPALGPEFFGPGLNNPRALQPNPILLQRAQEVVKANPNVRVFVDVTGEVEFTDQFGREVDVVDQFGRNPLEAHDFEEQQEFLQKQRKLQFDRRRQELESQLLREFGLFPGAGAAAAPAAAAAPV